jgi:hypothetical protein
LEICQIWMGWRRATREAQGEPERSEGFTQDRVNMVRN